MRRLQISTGHLFALLVYFLSKPPSPTLSPANKASLGTEGWGYCGTGVAAMDVEAGVVMGTLLMVSSWERFSRNRLKAGWRSSFSIKARDCAFSSTRAWF